MTAVQQACIGVSVTGVHWQSPVTLPRFEQINPILCRLLQKPSDFIKRFIQQLLCLLPHTLPNYIYITRLIASNSPLTDVKMFFFLFFFQAVILPTRQRTTYCTQTDIQTDTNIQNRYEEIDREEEKEKGRGPEADF